MIRTIVVDDESFIRQYIIKSIQTQNSLFKIIGEAGDGYTAWSMIQDLMPNVVFLDIKMPLLDGLEVLKLCSTLKSPPICVILSGYSDFSFAQKALKHNAFEYILKPIRQDTLKEVLIRIEDQIYSKKRLLQQEFFSQLLHNQPISYTGQDIKYAFENINYFYAYYLCVGSFCTYHYNQFGTLVNYWSEINFEDTITSFISSNESLWIINEETENDCFIAYGLSEKNDKLHNLFLTKLKSFIESFSYNVTLLYGLSTNNKEELKNHFIKLKNTASNLTIFGSSVIVDMNAPVKPSYSNVFSFSEQQLFSKLVAEKKFDLCHKQVDKYLNESKKNKCTQRRLNAILKRILEIANNNHITVSLTEQVDELITNTSNYKELSQGIHDILNDIFQSFPDNKSTNLVIYIKDFIDNHYTEQISLSLLANNFNISISYLSTLFKKSYEVSPNEYIIKLRIDKAKALLSANNEVNIRQIAELVGYSDPYYFSRIFKLTTGMTPSAYREKIDK